MEALDQEVVSQILDWLYEGNSLYSWCEENDYNPATIYKWTYKDEDFRQRFRHARTSGAEAKVDYAEHVARTPMIGEIVTEEVDSEGTVTKRKVVREDMLGHRKLVSETLIKVAACFDPRFGTKMSMDHSGSVSVELGDAMRKARERLAARDAE